MKHLSYLRLPLLTRRGLLTSLAVLTTLTGHLIAQDNIVALGRVSGAGTLLSGKSSVGAVITPVRNGVGDYTVTFTAAGGFAGVNANDLAVQAAIASSAAGDDTIKADVSAVTANSVTVEVQIDDVENNPSGQVAADADFFFTLFRAPNTAVAPATTPYLLASGRVNAAGTVQTSLGRHGVTASAILSGVGDVELTLADPGGFVGDVTTDYVLALTLEGSGASGHAIRGDVVDVTDDGELVVNVHTDDVQAVIDAADGVPASRAFFFTVFKLTPMPANTSDTSALIAQARVDAAGTLLSGPNAFDGGLVTSARLATGDYRVTITSPGAFSTRTAADFVAHATLNQSNSDDDGIMTEVVLENANTLHIDVSVTDVEASGEVEGLATDVGFYLTILDTVTDYQPDLRIGKRGGIMSMKGNDRYNSTGGGQALRLALEKLKWSKYYFVLENDGNTADNIRLYEQARGNVLRTKYFRLTGGRGNVTGSVIRTGLIESDVTPGGFIRYQGWVKYRSPKIRPRQSFEIHAHSLSDPTKSDVARLDVRSLPFRSGRGHGGGHGSTWNPGQGGGRGGNR
jgi:hypothetical protein